MRSQQFRCARDVNLGLNLILWLFYSTCKHDCSGETARCIGWFDPSLVAQVKRTNILCAGSLLTIVMQLSMIREIPQSRTTDQPKAHLVTYTELSNFTGKPIKNKQSVLSFSAI